MNKPGPDSGVTPSKPRLLGLLGPGLITGASDDDPSGIATYSQAGAQFGLGLSWVMVATYPLMTAVQIVSARLGRTTGCGIAGNLARHYPNWLLQATVFLLILANTINIGADLGAMADAVRITIGGPYIAYVMAFGLICSLMQVFLKYKRYVSYLKWLTLALFAYVFTLFIVEVDWWQVGRSLVLPSFSSQRDYMTTIVAVLGTTISPYLFFWQASQEVEDIRQHPTREPLTKKPSQGDAAIRRIEIDTLIGMAFSNIVAIFIVITTAVTLHAHGVTDIQTSAQAAEALRPIAGRAAFLLFTLGILGTGLLAVPVLAGSAAYALGEARRWRVGLDRHPLEAKAFYGAVVVATLLGAALDFTPVNPIKALFWSAVLNGIIAVPVMALMMLMARNPKVMKQWVISRRLQILGWVATAAMGACVVAMPILGQ